MHGVGLFQAHQALACACAQDSVRLVACAEAFTWWVGAPCTCIGMHKCEAEASVCVHVRAQLQSGSAPWPDVHPHGPNSSRRMVGRKYEAPTWARDEGPMEGSSSRGPWAAAAAAAGLDSSRRGGQGNNGMAAAGAPAGGQHSVDRDAPSAAEVSAAAAAAAGPLDTLSALGLLAEAGTSAGPGMQNGAALRALGELEALGALEGAEEEGAAAAAQGGAAGQQAGAARGTGSARRARVPGAAADRPPSGLHAFSPARGSSLAAAALAASLPSAGAGGLCNPAMLRFQCCLILWSMPGRHCLPLLYAGTLIATSSVTPVVGC